MAQQTAKSQQRTKPDAQPTSALQEPLYPILRDAIAERATDVHIDPVEGGKMVRFRVDGIIHEKQPIPRDLCQRLLIQTKIATNFEIDRSFLPQEGQLVLRDDQGTHDIRVSIVPVSGRESVHFRFLSPDNTIKKLDELGFWPEDLEKLITALGASTGLILVAGSTGSGKSTTMYSAANSLDLRSTVTVSIEDPVEFNIPHVRQVQVDEFHGLTMHEGLRCLLRMDPDAILVGEVRDELSAVTAARAALTGRLVVATIHALDAAMAVDALQHLSIPRYVLAGALRLIVTQDLVRRLCGHCSEKEELSPEHEMLFDQHQVVAPDHVYKPAGCDRCNGYGYYGRTGVFEVTQINRKLAQFIASDMKQIELQERFRVTGTHSIIADALTKAAKGITSMDEVMQLCLVERNE